MRFPGDAKKRITAVSCGGEHIIALSQNSEPYAWGRNDDGQLGIGFISDCALEP